MNDLPAREQIRSAAQPTRQLGEKVEQALADFAYGCFGFSVVITSKVTRRRNRTLQSMSTDRDQAVSEGDYEDRNDHTSYTSHQVSGSMKVGRFRFADKNRPATSTYPSQQTKKASNVHQNDGRLRTQLASIAVPQVYFLLC
jgi:hypothetical protein